MLEANFMYGPVRSRRLGRSLGVSPIPAKTCTFSCIYCQLGSTTQLTSRREAFYPVQQIVTDFEACLQMASSFDTVTIAGQGEPTLYLEIGDLIAALQERTAAPVAVITNGTLLGDSDVRRDLQRADMVLPTLAAFDEASFHHIHRPVPELNFADVIQGLEQFSQVYTGALWMEVMLMGGINDDDVSLQRIARLLQGMQYDKLFINTVVRPPAEPDVEEISPGRMEAAVQVLGAR